MNGSITFKVRKGADGTFRHDGSTARWDEVRYY